MSTIKVTNIKSGSTDDGGIAIDATGHVQVDGLQLPTAGPLSSRNLVQNGAMIVSQRGTSFDVNSEDKFTLDRFSTEWSAGTFECTITQESDGPQGFNKSLKVACDTAYTPTTSDNFGLRTHLEGQDFQSLGFGSTGAKDLTLSFYVKGTAKQYSCAVQFLDSSGNYHIQTRSFSVTSSWQRVILTFEGNGAALNTAIVNDNTVGFVIQWWLAAGPDDIFSEDTTWVDNPSPTFHAVTGQDNFFNSTSNEFYITGVQLEVGEKATPFEHRSFGDELARCERYFEKYRLHAYTFVGNSYTSTQAIVPLHWKVLKRSSPTITAPSVGTGTGEIALTAGNANYPSGVGTHTYTTRGPGHGELSCNGYSGLNSQGICMLYSNGVSYLNVDAEL